MIILPSKAVKICALSVLLGAVLLLLFGRSFLDQLFVKLKGGRTVSEALILYGDKARTRLNSAFSKAGVAYPPSKVTFLALKEEKTLEVWSSNGEKWQFVKTYPILAASGKAGPKLRQGDRQVPEGLYQIEGLNPNSDYHLSIKLNYPNAFDLQQAQADGRTKLGGDIFIHGKSASVGCLAMGDEAIEDLFVLAADVGENAVSIIVSPKDPRGTPLPRALTSVPAWLPQLYDQIEAAFRPFTRTGAH